MLKNGEFVKIKYSNELLQLDLCELVTRTVMVTKVMPKGAYVLVLTGRLKGQERYIPNSSIISKEGMDKLRANEIIRHALL